MELQEMKDLLPEGAPEALETMRNAKKTFGKIKREFLHNVEKELDPMDDDNFWRYVDRLKELMERFKNYKAGRNTIKDACQELFRKAVIEHDNAAYINCIRFSVKWRMLTREISKKLYDHPSSEGLGDDSYGDMLDSFPMHGRETTEKVLRGDIEKDDYYIGENYFGLHLSEGAERYFDVYISNIKELEDEIQSRMSWGRKPKFQY